ncbi:MAG: HlyD family efflux transporter periplasmic adaptor subunit [Acidobacteriota bacterium]
MSLGSARWVRGLAAAVVVLAAVLALQWRAGSASGLEEWVAVERGDLPIQVEISGELAAVDSEFIGPPALARVWSFKIAYLAPEGMEAKVGDVLLRFDITDLMRSLREKENERDAAAKRLEKRRADLEIQRRQEALTLADAEGRLRRAQLKTEVPEDLIEGNDLRSALIDRDLYRQEVDFRQRRLDHLDTSVAAELASLEGSLSWSQQEVESIQGQIEQMTVRAPRPGTVIYRSNWQGEKKQVGDSAWRTESILEIPDLEAMRGDGTVAEALSGRLRVGQPVTLRLDAYPDELFSGSIARIHKSVRPRSFNDPRKVVRLEIALDSIDSRRMRPAMRWRGLVEVEEESARDVLLLPLESVHLGSDGAMVWVDGPLGARARAIRVGRRNGERVEVLEGLEEGEVVSRRPLG